jgi:Fur family peroxide stress response transcriptional regulator
VSAARKNEPKSCDKSYDETISEKGFRFTEQRRAVYDALMGKRDHPTAVEVFIRVKGRMPSISLATVYNCLETLTDCGLVKAVNHDREPSRYCPNLAEHAHLFCDGCHGVLDVPLRSHEVSFRGLCPKCAAASEKISANKEKK